MNTFESFLLSYQHSQQYNKLLRFEIYPYSLERNRIANVFCLFIVCKGAPDYWSTFFRTYQSENKTIFASSIMSDGYTTTDTGTIHTGV